MHALVFCLLTIFNAAGGKFSAAKDEAAGAKVIGAAAEYLRVVYDVLAFDGRSMTSDGFARLAIEAYRYPIAKARAAKTRYMEWLVNAWKTPQ